MQPITLWMFLAFCGSCFKTHWVCLFFTGTDKPNQQPLWQVIQAAQSSSDKSYLIYMAVRLQEMHRLLKPTGSIYLHCDPTMSHYLKLLMDVVFGRRNFRNEIVWYYYNGVSNTKKDFAHKHDVLLFYADRKHNTFSDIDAREPYVENSNYVRNWESYGGGPSNPRGKRMHDVWRIPSINNMAKDRTGYPTQKPLSLLERIVKASSNEGDMVFDPFCGCATTLVAADRLNRQWAGIDISSKAVNHVIERVKEDQGLFQDIVPRVDLPQRTDLGKLKPYKSLENRKYLYGEQRGYCNGCKKHFELRNFHVDHIIAQAKGGTDHVKNLQLLCGLCKSVKGDRGMDYLKSKLGVM